MRVARLVSSLALFGCLACGHDGPPDSDEQGDGDGDGESVRLAEALPIPLDQVGSFVAQMPFGSPNASADFRAGEAPQLFALTLDGDVIEISLVEGADGTGADMPPPIREIFATPAWIIFATSGYSVYELVDGEQTEIPCSTILARRSDGVLFCSALMPRPSGDNFGNVGAGSESILSNATGDVMYWVAFDDLNLAIVYRVTADAEGMSGALVDGVWRISWMVVNADGDLLVNHRPAGAEQSITEIYPLDGAPISVPTTGVFLSSMVGTAGPIGAPDENDFYLLDLAQPVSESEVVVLRDQGDGGFVQANDPVDLPLIAGGCTGIHRLSDGIYSLCNMALVRLVEDGLVLADPVELPIADATSMLPLGPRFAESLMVLPATDGTTNKFVRHDGVNQTAVAFGDTFELLGFSVSRAGDINFLGVTIDTHEKVIGSVAADSTELTIVSSEQVDPDAVISFTRIN